MASQEERAPLVASHAVDFSQHIQRVQENAQNIAAHHFYTSHSLFVLSVLISACKVKCTQIMASLTVLAFREPQTSRPLELWISVVLLQDILYFIFLLMKIPHIRRVQQSLVIEESCSVLVFDRLFTVYLLHSTYIIWLIPGNLWYWRCKDCYDDAPILTTLCAVYIFAGYLYGVVPVVLMASLCLCLPVLIVVIMFIANPSQNPADENLLQSLKGEKYDRDVHREQSTCAICACDFEARQSVIVLKCDARHFFHEECIKRWLTINANCPICRKEVKDSL